MFPLIPMLAAAAKTVVGKAVIQSAAAAAINGLSARAQARAERAQALGDQAQQFTRLRDAAEAAGFNPLTVLRSNPGGGMVNPTPALASNAFIGDALGAGIQTYFNGDQIRRDAERDALDKQMMREEIRMMQLQGKALEKNMRFGFDIPQSNNYSGADDRWKTAFGPPPPTVMVDGVVKFVDPGMMSAQDFQNRYGDVAEEAYGASVVAKDFAYQEKAGRWGGDPISVTRLPAMPGVPVNSGALRPFF